MKMRLSCRAMGLACPFVVVEDTEDAIVEKIAQHLKEEHAIQFTEELNWKARDLLRLVEV